LFSLFDCIEQESGVSTIRHRCHQPVQLSYYLASVLSGSLNFMRRVLARFLELATELFHCVLYGFRLKDSFL
jgi:hypothetical protein